MAFLKYLFLIGFVLIFLGIILIFISSIYNIKETNVKSAGIIFIGPFPIGYASDKKMFYFLIALIFIFSIFFYFLRKI